MKIKCGIEIHQQLDSHKLFCHCPSVLRSDVAGFSIKRKLHAVAGESGAVDAAAKHEALRDRTFVYEGFDTTCLVELDEEPPQLINSEALATALHVALLLHCEILPVSQIMRKTVIDGSNTSGFQRTVLLARNGYVETAQGRVGIDSVSLEEDSARIMNEQSSEERRVYRLDRLGIALVEIGTAPDITSAAQAKEVALHIGDILRSCKVKRGIGTIRQDVNISIAGHPRVEIKGFQDVKLFVPTIEQEIKRQEEQLAKGVLSSEVRNALPDGSSAFLRPMPGAARMYPETDLPLLYLGRKILEGAKKSLPQLRSDLKEELVKRGLREDEVIVLLKSNLVEEFNHLFSILSDSRFVFRVLLEMPKDVAKKLCKPHQEIENLLGVDVLASVLEGVNKGKIVKDEVRNVLEDLASGVSFSEAIKRERADMGDVEQIVARIVKEKPGLSMGGYMGLVMQEFKGKVSGKEVSDILKKLV